MRYYEVAPNHIIRAGSQSFTYSSRDVLSIGCLVQIEVGNKLHVGVIIKSVERPDYATKEISSIIEAQPIPKPLLETSLWMSSYYATPLAQVLQTVLPRGLTKKRRARLDHSPVVIRKRTTFVLTDDQNKALQAFDSMTPGSALLHGVTGSGKTAVYIELAKRTLLGGKSCIILVPEIALTSQLVAEFSHHFENIILTHSKQTEAERHLAWKEALSSDTPRIVIGPRSALFLPLENLGLVVIDECHEPSFKQEQSPRYSALRVASKLVETAKAKLILGSATPLIADYYRALGSDRPLVTMSLPAQKGTKKPTVSLVDMTKRSNFKRHRFLSDALLSQLEKTFESGKQALIFHNRRGSASITLCENCGWQAGCPRCFVPLTLHGDMHKLRCHICGFTSAVPTSCPECGHVDIVYKGIGTKLIESELKKLFPKQTIKRFDGDSETAESVDTKYNELYSGAIDLIIGTQVIAKGLDLPHLRTVGVVQADAGLSLPDFSSSERTFQLLSQVIGRVGRSHHSTSVIVQSYQPNHPAVVDGISQNYKEFYDRTIKQRRHTLFPPFRFLLKLTCIYKTEASVVKNSRQFADKLRNLYPDIEVLGPSPAFYEHQSGSFRWQIIIKSARRQTLVDLLAHLPPAHWQYELDPVSLL